MALRFLLPVHDPCSCSSSSYNARPSSSAVSAARNSYTGTRSSVPKPERWWSLGHGSQLATRRRFATKSSGGDGGNVIRRRRRGVGVFWSRNGREYWRPLSEINADWKSQEAAAFECREAQTVWGFARSKAAGYAELSARAATVEAVEPSTRTVEDVTIVDGREEEEEPKLGGGEGGDGRDGGDEGGGGGGGGGDGAGDEERESGGKMSVSQILTLVYAAIVGGGGLIGFAKSGSNKSLLTGGGAALTLFIVYAQLPIHPTIASVLGLGISAALLGVMYPRFKSSGKFMPAGLVALVSLIMTGGYLHGIVRTVH